MAIRRLRIRRGYCLGLDGNLHLPSESLWITLANTHGYCNCKRNSDGDGYSDCNYNGKCDGDGDGNCYCGAEIYADTQAASNTAASAVRSALAHVSTGTRVNFASPRNAYCC